MTIRMATRFFALLALLLALAACERDGPFERAGEAVDDAITDIEQEMDDSSGSVADEANEVMDNTADSVEEALNEAADEIDDATSS